MARKQFTSYESILEQLTAEYGESYRTNFHEDRASFNLPKMGTLGAPVTLTKGQQSRFNNPISGKPFKPTAKQEEDATEPSDENKNLSLKASSTIQSANYWPDKEFLIVSFKSGGSYSYKGVPLNIILSWEQASSAGSYFYYNIRTSFSYQKL